MSIEEKIENEKGNERGMRSYEEMGYKIKEEVSSNFFFFFFQAEDGIRDYKVTGVQTCALPIYIVCC